jgi:two-component system chemotaxis response regulator CheY
VIDRSQPVLLVEPRATTLSIISDLLGSLGFETIETASDSTTALELLEQKGPRLVIADLHIGPTPGLQFLRTIRSDDKLKRTPIILAAETLSPTEALAIKHAGADSFLLKPFRAEALSLKVEAAFKARPKPRAVPELTLKGPLSVALGRRFQRHHD